MFKKARRDLHDRRSRTHVCQTFYLLALDGLRRPYIIYRLTSLRRHPRTLSYAGGNNIPKTI